MLITNEEAANKHCPIKFINPKVNILCEGEDCMAWQTYEDPHRGTYGYCGLAGIPVDVRASLASK